MGDFYNDLSQENPTDTTFWFEIYRLAFPSIQNIEKATREMQRFGVDYLITTARIKGKINLENKRRLSYYEGDIALEEYSDWDRKVLGWGLATGLKADYLFYLTKQDTLCFVIEFKYMQRLFKVNWLKWVENGWRLPPSHSSRDGRQWITTNIAVPTKFFDPTYFWRYDLKRVLE